MADVKEYELATKSSPALTDFIRLIGGTDSVSYKTLVSDIAKAIVENYTGSSVAGSNQSIKSALDSLNSNTTRKVKDPTNELYGIGVFKDGVGYYLDLRSSEGTRIGVIRF